MVAVGWEKAHDRPYLYAGEGRGVDVAGWKQAVRAEIAVGTGMRYGQVLLDFVKAFDRIPHWVMVREARRLRYPLWMLRLSIHTYRMSRVIRIGQVVSGTVRASRGITAGSGLATTEMTRAHQHGRQGPAD